MWKSLALLECQGGRAGSPCIKLLVYKIVAMEVKFPDGQYSVTVATFSNMSSPAQATCSPVGICQVRLVNYLRVTVGTGKPK